MRIIRPTKLNRVIRDIKREWFDCPLEVIDCVVKPMIDDPATLIVSKQRLFSLGRLGDKTLFARSEAPKHVDGIFYYDPNTKKMERLLVCDDCRFMVYRLIKPDKISIILRFIFGRYVHVTINKDMETSLVQSYPCWKERTIGGVIHLSEKEGTMVRVGFVPKLNLKRYTAWIIGHIGDEDIPDKRPTLTNLLATCDMETGRTYVGNYDNNSITSKHFSETNIKRVSGYKHRSGEFTFIKINHDDSLEMLRLDDQEHVVRQVVFDYCDDLDIHFSAYDGSIWFLNYGHNLLFV